MMLILSFVLAVGVIGSFFILDDMGIIEWSVYYSIPVGIVNGIVILLIHFKSSQKKKELDKLR